MAAPQVPIDVDPATGVWTTDGLPMIYLPRHFLIGLTEIVEQALGRDAAERHLYEAGYRAARTWCEHEARTHGLAGIEVFHHYLRRLSQRGWGRFDGSGIDPATGHGVVALKHSCFALHYGPGAGRKVCFQCAGWFPGALDWVGQSTGRDFRLSAREIACASDGATVCVFEVAPRP